MFPDVRMYMETWLGGLGDRSLVLLIIQLLLTPLPIHFRRILLNPLCIRVLRVEYRAVESKYEHYQKEFNTNHDERGGEHDSPRLTFFQIGVIRVGNYKLTQNERRGCSKKT